MCTLSPPPPQPHNRVCVAPLHPMRVGGSRTLSHTHSHTHTHTYSLSLSLSLSHSLFLSLSPLSLSLSLSFSLLRVCRFLVSIRVSTQCSVSDLYAEWEADVTSHHKKFDDLKVAATAELDDNLVEQERRFGMVVQYGQVVQLWHQASRRFLRVSPTSNSKAEPANMRMELHPIASRETYVYLRCLLFCVCHLLAAMCACVYVCMSMCAAATPHAVLNN